MFLPEYQLWDLELRLPITFASDCFDHFSPLTLSQQELAEGKQDRPVVDCSPARPQCNHDVWMNLPKWRVCIWWSLCTLYLLVCQVRFTVWKTGSLSYSCSVFRTLVNYHRLLSLPKWSRSIQSCICFSLSCNTLWVSESTVYIFCIIYLHFCDITFLLLLVKLSFHRKRSHLLYINLDSGGTEIEPSYLHIQI